MIKFFRNIRQTLLMENKTSKYLTYAFGEIVLVVVGILIALQINAWYDASKKEKLKQVYTSNLISDLTKDTIQLNARVKLNEYQLRHLDSVLTFIQHPNTTAEDIKQLGKNDGLAGLRTINTYNDNTFNILKSTGNIALFNDTIIQTIMELNRLQFAAKGVADGNRSSYFNLYGSYSKLYVSEIEGNRSLEDDLWVQVDAQKHASLFISATRSRRHSISRFIELTNEVIAKTEELLGMLIPN